MNVLYFICNSVVPFLPVTCNRQTFWCVQFGEHTLKVIVHLTRWEKKSIWTLFSSLNPSFLRGDLQQTDVLIRTIWRTHHKSNYYFDQVRKQVNVNPLFFVPQSFLPSRWLATDGRTDWRMDTRKEQFCQCSSVRWSPILRRAGICSQFRAVYQTLHDAEKSGRTAPAPVGRSSPSGPQLLGVDCSLLALFSYRCLVLV